MRALGRWTIEHGTPGPVLMERAGAGAAAGALRAPGVTARVPGRAPARSGAVTGWSEAPGRPVLAIDIASGLPADSGRPRGAAIRAPVTATFGYAKIGQVVYPGV